MTLIFEDELTIRYQVQEMLRAERIFEDGRASTTSWTLTTRSCRTARNWKATMLIEYPDAEERGMMLARLIGIEDRVWVQVEGSPRVYAIADEDSSARTDEKTVRSISYASSSSGR